MPDELQVTHLEPLMHGNRRKSRRCRPQRDDGAHQRGAETARIQEVIKPIRGADEQLQVPQPLRDRLGVAAEVRQANDVHATPHERDVTQQPLGGGVAQQAHAGVPLEIELPEQAGGNAQNLALGIPVSQPRVISQSAIGVHDAAADAAPATVGVHRGREGVEGAGGHDAGGRWLRGRFLGCQTRRLRVPNGAVSPVPSGAEEEEMGADQRRVCPRIRQIKPSRCTTSYARPRACPAQAHDTAQRETHPQEKKWAHQSPCFVNLLPRFRRASRSRAGWRGNIIGG
mmetsp:Transcript_56569/g.162323  ORF Transcript_56569/g.162323 Transcript_56569/m.162323 type:complete len:285 (+) Transcript_56569:237-1091(+)